MLAVWGRHRAMTVYLGLGSNCGDRAGHLTDAISELDSLDRITVSSGSAFLETAPVGPVEQPDFLNAVVALETTLSPRRLLETCLDVEQHHGRNRSVEQRWGPRTLDLDILLFDDMIVREPGLVIPHPELADRVFVLEPLCQIAPDVIHPVSGETIAAMLRSSLRRTP